MRDVYITKDEIEALRLLQKHGKTVVEEVADCLTSLSKKAPRLLRITAYTDFSLYGHVTAAGEMFLLRYTANKEDATDYKGGIHLNHHWHVIDVGQRPIFVAGENGWQRLTVDLTKYQPGTIPMGDDKEVAIHYPASREGWRTAYRLARQFAHASPGNPARLDLEDLSRVSILLGTALCDYVTNVTPGVRYQLMDREEVA